jgi:hypothetical protein
MFNRTFCAVALAVAALATPTHAAPQQPFIHDCHFGACSDQYIVSTTKTPDSTLTVKTKSVWDCRNARDTSCTGEVEYQDFKVRCAAPGYVEYPGQRVPEPEADPPHATQVQKALWTAVCNRQPPPAPAARPAPTYEQVAAYCRLGAAAIYPNMLDAYDNELRGYAYRLCMKNKGLQP